MHANYFCWEEMPFTTCQSHIRQECGEYQVDITLSVAKMGQIDEPDGHEQSLYGTHNLAVHSPSQSSLVY